MPIQECKNYFERSTSSCVKCNQTVPKWAHKEKAWQCQNQSFPTDDESMKYVYLQLEDVELLELDCEEKGNELEKVSSLHTISKSIPNCNISQTPMEFCGQLTPSLFSGLTAMWGDTKLLEVFIFLNKTIFSTLVVLINVLLCNYEISACSLPLIVKVNECSMLATNWMSSYGWPSDWWHIVDTFITIFRCQQSENSFHAWFIFNRLSSELTICKDVL